MYHINTRKCTTCVLFPCVVHVWWFWCITNVVHTHVIYVWWFWCIINVVHTHVIHMQNTCSTHVSHMYTGLQLRHILHVQKYRCNIFVEDKCVIYIFHTCNTLQSTTNILQVWHNWPCTVNEKQDVSIGCCVNLIYASFNPLIYKQYVDNRKVACKPRQYLCYHNINQHLIKCRMASVWQKRILSCNIL